MKKLKTIRSFFFKGMTHQQVVDLLNSEYPVSIKYNEDLVNRVHARYPLIDKIQVSIIVKAIFSTFRELLILGKILNFNNFLFDCKLHFFDYRRDGHILPSLKVKISTPPPLRKNDQSL